MSLVDRASEFRTWAVSRINHCRAQEVKFGNAWQLREKHQHGPPQALVEAWSERRALQAALQILSPGYLERLEQIDAIISPEVQP